MKAGKHLLILIILIASTSSLFAQSGDWQVEPAAAASILLKLSERLTDTSMTEAMVSLLLMSIMMEIWIFMLLILQGTTPPLFPTIFISMMARADSKMKLQ